MKTIAILLFCTIALHAADVSGKWSGFAGGPVFLTLKQDGANLSGSAGPNDGQQMAFDGGKIEADRLSFKVGAIQFDLRAAGDEIKGELKNGDQAVEVVLTRVGSAASRAQAAGQVFEVASVKPIKSVNGGFNPRGGSIRTTQGQITMENVSLRKCIGYAYGIGEDKDYAISGPDWLNSERYDITAKWAPGHPQVLLMMQNLLAERFKMSVHRETKDLPMYALVVAKGGSKLREVENGSGGFSGAPGKLTGQKVPMFKIAEHLSQMVDRPVFDMTGLKGFFEFTLEWTPDEKASLATPGDATNPGAGPSIFSAIQAQLGLRLEARRGPVEVLVVDHAEKIPIGN
jgi:uncharacterized protein (TIGR03435 family)